MPENSFLSEEELHLIPFNSIGTNVKISRKASIYSPDMISLGNNVRIDDFCILSGEIKIGSFVHISAYSALYGKFGIHLEDYVTISGRVIIYSQNDDYSGKFMTNPTLPKKFTNVTGGMVTCEKFAIIGAGSIVLPHVIIGEGAAVGSMSLVNKNIPPWKIYIGIPANYFKERERNIILLENELKNLLKNLNFF
ncbi:MAG: acyltransferase [Bacteroidales bacterium]|nr:acyltransferase [Bacteroidales bacterium]